MADFPQLGQTNINPLAAFYDSQTASLANDLARNTLGSRTQISQNTADSGSLANQLSSATLGSNTEIAANTARGGDLANQLAAQKNPLEITGMRQQLGIDPSPTLDRLQNLYNGGGGQPPSASPGSSEAVPGLGSRESSNDPSAVNAGGYSGMFQHGTARLADIGAYTPADGESLKTNQWKGTLNIPGFPEVKTQADYLKSPGAQRAAMAMEVANTDQAIATTPGADKFDPNGLRAVAHLGGVAGMQRFVSSGGLYDPADSNGTRLSDYYKQFAAGGVPALQAAFGHPDGHPGQPAAPGAAARNPGSVQVAGPGAPTGSQPTEQPPFVGPDPTKPRPGYIAGPLPGLSDQPSLPSPNGMSAVAPDGPMPGLPDHDLAALGAPPTAPPQAQPQAPTTVVAPAQPQLMPSASAQPPPGAVQPPATQPATGMNSPQVQQAQELMRRAAQIEMIAAQTPNDPRAKATAAAMAADLKGRAAVLMQADSVTTGPNGVQTHSLTGKQDSAATPAMNYQPDPNNPGVLISPGEKPVVLPPGRATQLSDGSVWITGPGGTFKEGRGANLEGASAAATAAAGGTAAAASAAKTRDALVPLARSSGQAIGNIDYGLRQLDDANKAGLPTGYFSQGVASAAAALKYYGYKLPGVDPKAVTDIQTAQKTLSVVGAAILKDALGNAEITDGKIAAFIHTQPGIELDPDAIPRILNWARSQFTYDHEMAMDGLKNVDPKSGLLSPGWQASYITKHGSAPIFDRASGEMKQPDGQAPDREPPAQAAPKAPAQSGAYTDQNPFVGSRADVMKLPPNTPFRNPADGKVLYTHPAR